LQFDGVRNVLIFHLGGRRCDVSILTIKDGHIEVKAIAGCTDLGGKNFDERMVKHFVEEFRHTYIMDLTTNILAVRKLRAACEWAKCTLSYETEAIIEIRSLFEENDFGTCINRTTFENLNEDLFRSTMGYVELSLNRAEMDKSHIHDIVLIGGSARIPMLQKLLQDFFIGKELKISVNPDEAVAYGAAVQAAIIAGAVKSEEVQALLAINVTPVSPSDESMEE
jgi:L1 cell adhesion molecule like protein